MKRILITDEMIDDAKVYSENLFKDRMFKQTPEDRLCTLMNYFEEKQNCRAYYNYLSFLKQFRNYFNRLTPNYFHLFVNTFFNPQHIKLNKSFSIDVGAKDKNGNTKTTNKKFHEWVVWAMRYDDVGKDKNLLGHFRKLGIKSCVYCNAQYAVTADKENGNQESEEKSKYLKNYTLDHIWPKSKYPFLCTNFFNLVPCCSQCNSTKKDNLDLMDFEFYTTDKEKAKDVFEFQLDGAGFIRYYVKHDCDLLKVNFNAIERKDEKWVKLFNEKFHVEELANAHCDELEELLWKRMMYDDCYMTVLKKQFEKLISTADFNRFLLGNYDKPEDVHKRPLAKMTQDIAKQLGMIKRDDKNDEKTIIQKGRGSF